MAREAARPHEPSGEPDSTLLPLAQLAAAAVGLVVFAAMIVRGLLAANPVEVVLGRAIVGLLAGTLLGTLAGRLAELILNDRPQMKRGGTPSAPPAAAPGAQPAAESAKT